MTATATAYGCTVSIDFKDGTAEHVTSSGHTWHDYPYPPTVNDPALTDFAKRVAAPIVGEAALHFDEKPVMGGEVRKPSPSAAAPFSSLCAPGSAHTHRRAPRTTTGEGGGVQESTESGERDARRTLRSTQRPSRGSSPSSATRMRRRAAQRPTTRRISRCTRTCCPWAWRSTSPSPWSG